MVSENPPRHSRNDQEPVTIDLKAEAAKPDSADFGSAEADAPVASDRVDNTEATDEPTNLGEDMGPESPGPVPSSAANEPPKPAPRSGAIVGGVVGAVLALLGAGGLQYGGFLPQPGPDATLEKTNADMMARINGLQAGLDALAAQNAKIVDPSADLAKLDGRIAALETTISAPSSSVSVNDSSKIAALASEIANLRTSLEVAGADTGKALAGFQMRLEAAEKKISEPRDDVQVARAIASAGLKAAIDRGGPFMAELETLANVAKDDPAVTELRNFAAVGVPSRADLLAAYPDVANAMVTALKSEDPDQSWWDRLMSSATSVVKVRPVGNIEGEGPDAVIARMEIKLANGDLAGVALEWNGLPDVAKTAGADFKSKLDARIRVESLVGSTLDRAVTGTATTNGG